jgi:hypothetical protein
MYAIVRENNVKEPIGLNRLRWFGHVERMEGNRIPQKYYI